MTENACQMCGMPCEVGEYHPYAACLLFMATRSSSAVRYNLEAIAQHVLATGENWRDIRERPPAAKLPPGGAT